jgi:hypothetical protein
MSISIRREAASMISAVWIGLIVGVSFFAAPIKFTANGVELEQLLAVGQVTFQAFTWVELAAFVLLVVASLSHLTRGVGVAIFVLCLLLAIQKLGVLPSLDLELDRTVAGKSFDATSLHFIYVAIDCVKLAVLFALSLLLRSKNEGRKVPDAAV